MGSPAAAIATAIEQALRSSLALQSAMGTTRLYVEVPANAPLPYVVIGDDTVLLSTSGCADEGEITSVVQWWSKLPTLDKGAQARAMGSAIVQALNTALILDGHEVVEWELEQESYATDPDQSSRGRAVFRYLTTEIVA